MARTKQEITDEIKQSFIANEVLQQIYGIDGTLSFDEEFSIVAFEAALIDVIASSGKTIEDIIDIHKKEVIDLVNTMTPGTLLWYQQEAMRFQLGDTLQWNQDKMIYEYPSIDPSKQIVKLCAVIETNGQLLMKVANIDSNGDPIPLTTSPIDELNAFSTYMNQVKYAGVHLNIVSREPDEIKLKLKIYYNPTVLSNDGSMLNDNTAFPIEDTVKDYLRLLPFNGRFNVTDLIDSLQQTEGVINPIFKSAEARYGLMPWSVINDYYLANAGYMSLEDLEIEYIAG